MVVGLVSFALDARDVVGEVLEKQHEGDHADASKATSKESLS